MKIRKVMDKKVSDKIYYRYIVSLPKEVVEKSKLVGKNLKVKLTGKKIIIEKQ